MQREDLRDKIGFIFERAEPAFFRRAFAMARGDVRLQEHFAVLPEKEQKRLTESFGGDKDCRAIVLSVGAARFLFESMQLLADVEQPEEGQPNIPKDLAQQLDNHIVAYVDIQIERHQKPPQPMI